jgi:SAM-dependent methyltransferase
MTENTIHHSAEQGFSSAATVYAKGRPEYPPELMTWLVRHFGIKHGTLALDIGAGTGKFTKLLASTGVEVAALEPVAEMRQELSKTLPDITVTGGTAAQIPWPDSHFDAVFCAQAFHWFATKEALSEMRRVLKPDGALGLVWNVRDESVDWVAEITAIIAPYEGGTPRFHLGQWRQAFDLTLFSDPELHLTSYDHVGPPETVIIDRFLSVSFIAAMPDHERQLIADRLRTLIDTHPDLRGKSEIAVPYRTEAYICRPL